MDIGPTVLELAGVEPAESMQAQSLLPALRGEPWQGRDLVFAEHPTDGVYEGHFMTMVRSERSSWCTSLARSTGSSLICKQVRARSWRLAGDAAGLPR